MELRKKILFITGTRADYGKIKSLIKSVDGSLNFQAFVFVSGMHLVDTFGNTYNEVLKDNYKNVYVAYGLEYTPNMSINLGNIICHLTGYVNKIKPDMIVVHGDRIDALAGAVVGALNNIIVSHIEGGEVSGTIDESIRHAISKFAHLHFVSHNDAKSRLIQLGEKERNIFVIGSPDIDLMMSDNLPSIDTVKEYYNISFDKYAIFIYHPVTTEYDVIGRKIQAVVEALIRSNRQYISVFPNNDLGSEIILNEFNRLIDNSKFAIFPSLRFEYFLTLLKNADFMIGNSSAGIRETCIYGIPSIDIGNRQSGRYNINLLRNIQHSDEDITQILEAIENVYKHRIHANFFGKGNSTQQFMDIIQNSDLWILELQKKFIDLGGVL